MSKYKYALLLDSLFPEEVSKAIINEIYSKPEYDVSLFLLNRDNMMANPFPVYSIADYFNFKGVSIITSQSTLNKVKAYPDPGLSIIIGEGEDILNFINVKTFDLHLIDNTVKEYYAKHNANVS